MTSARSTTSAIFQEKLLDGRHARLAYPLVCHVKPAMPINDWIAFVRRWSRLSPNKGGIMALNDRRGYLHAIFTYRVEQNLRFGCFVRITDVIVGHLPGETLNRAIMECTDRLAERIGCSMIVIEPTHETAHARMLAAAEIRPFGFLRGRERRRLADCH
jgi:hypothetical protein